MFGICGTTLVASNGLRFLGFRPFAEEERAAPCCSSVEIEEEKEGKLSEVEAIYEAFDGKEIDSSDSCSSSSSSSPSSKEFSDWNLSESRPREVALEEELGWFIADPMFGFFGLSF